MSTDGGISYANITGATSTTLTIPAAALTDNGKRYRAVFNNGQGQAITSGALLTVDVPPSITAQPSSVAVTVGQVATFTAAATATPAPSVQWQVSSDEGVTYSNITGATGSSLRFTAQAWQSGYRYRVVFTNAVGQVISSAAILLVW